MSVFLELDGIAGESQDARHVGAIEVQSWTFGVSSTGATHMGGGAGAGKASFAVLAIGKTVDVATPSLLLATATGTHIPTATLTVTTGGESPSEYLVIALEDVVITSCVVSDGSDGSDGSDAASMGGRPSEHVALSYGTIQVTYRQQLPSGQVGPAAEFAWDVARSRPA